MQKQLETHTWYDLLGAYYESNVKSTGKASDMGQFFTPHTVVDLLTELTLQDNNGVCYDPCGGSGRFLLSYHIKHPGGLCFSHDLDKTSCMMATLNFLIHGVKGSVCRYDSLTGEFYGGWKINEQPFSIMSVDSINESLVFIGEEIPNMKTLHEATIKGSQSCLDDYI